MSQSAPVWDEREVFKRISAEVHSWSPAKQLDVLQYLIRYLNPRTGGKSFLENPKRSGRPNFEALRELLKKIREHVPDSYKRKKAERCFRHHLMLICGEASTHKCKIHP